MGKKAEIGPDVYMDDEAEIGDNVSIGRFTEILPGSIIGDNCVIGSRCIIGHPTKLQLQKADFSATSPKVPDFMVKEAVTKIGGGSIIRSGAVIYGHVIIGTKLRTGHNVLIREHVIMGDDCVVGTQAILDGYIKIGSGSMIQSQCYVCQSVKLGEGVFIAPRCAFLDNKRMILGQGLEGATVEDYVRIGAGTIVLPAATIGKYALIGARSVVTRDIPSKAVAYGTPTKVQGFLTDDQIRAYVDSVRAWKY